MMLQTSSAGTPPVLQLMATSAPADASPSAIARPMPRELPVTNAFFPKRLKLGTSDSLSACTVGASVVAIAVVISSTPRQSQRNQEWSLVLGP